MSAVDAKARAAVALDVAKGLVLGGDRRFWQVKIDVAGASSDGTALSMFASDNHEGIHAVVEGRAAMALVNPSVMLTLAYRGTGPFTKPMPVRAIAVNPSFDQLAFVVTADTGLTSLEDVREKRYPLRISLRGQRNHSLHPILDCVLAAAGFSIADVISWGGSVHYEPSSESGPLFDNPARLQMAQDGTINAIFDEAICRWLEKAQRLGMLVLPLGDTTVRNLERAGFREGVIDKATYPLLDGDVKTIDFSGFAIYVRADAPDDLVTGICAGLDLRRNAIPWEGIGPLPIAHMCRDTADGPLDVPLHPAAERYWHALGCDTTPLPGISQIHPRCEPPERPPRIRSMLTLQIASEVLARAKGGTPGAFATLIQMRRQTEDFDAWFATMEAGDPQASLAAVAEGRTTLAIVTAADLQATTLPVRSIATLDGCELVCHVDASADVVAAFRESANESKETL